MYRSTTAGLALEASLESVTSRLGVTMNEAQRATLWRAFEDAFSEALEEVPKDRIIAIDCSSRKRPIPGRTATATRSPSSSSSSAAASTSASSTAHHTSSSTSSLLGAGFAGNDRENRDKHDTQQHDVDEHDEDDDEQVFSYPMYRCIDGLWEILVKDATIHLTGEQAALLGTTRLKIDELKIEGREAGKTSAVHGEGGEVTSPRIKQESSGAGRGKKRTR